MTADQPPAPQPAARATSRPHRWIYPSLLGLLFLLVQIVAAPSVGPSNDTYRYARQSLELLGRPPAVAQQTALRDYCVDAAHFAARTARAQPATANAPHETERSAAACIAASPQGLAPTSPRYEAIFTSRIGFPTLAAPLVALLGPNAGLAATSLLFTMLGGLLAFLLLRHLGTSTATALMGQGLYYASPIGWWGGYGLSEGPAIALSFAALFGALLLLQRRLLPGTLLVGLALAAGASMRYANFLLIAGALAAAAVLILVTIPRYRHAGTGALLAVSGALAAGMAVTAKALHWPGLSESLQDTFTVHFSRPDVADPWHQLMSLNQEFWLQWGQDQLRSPWLLLAVGVGTWATFRHSAPIGWVVLGVALTGVAAEIAHPVANQGDRLMLQIWTAAVVGLPLLWHRHQTRGSSAATGAPAARPPLQRSSPESFTPATNNPR